MGIPAEVAILAASTFVTIPPLPTPGLPAPPNVVVSISAITGTSLILCAPCCDGGAS